MAAASTVAGITLVASVVVAMTGSGDPTDPNNTHVPGRAALTAAERTSQAPGPPRPEVVGPVPDGPPQVVDSAAGGDPRHADVVPPPVSASSPVPTVPAEPVPCTNQMLGVAVEAGRQEHRLGEHLLLRLVVANVGDQACVRDLGSDRLEIVVWSGDGATRLWSSNDCAGGAGPDLRTLEPGKPLTFPVTWSGRTSVPGCTVAGGEVPAGTYRLLSRVDDVISAPTPFIRSP